MRQCQSFSRIDIITWRPLASTLRTLTHLCIGFCAADLLFEVFDHSVPLSDRAKFGVYIVRICKGHDWHYLILDDRFPVHAQTSKPAFARCDDVQEIWVPLIEKAFAKLHQSYDSLVSGACKPKWASPSVCSGISIGLRAYACSKAWLGMRAPLRLALG